MNTLYTYGVGLLDSIMLGEYEVFTRCEGLLVLAKEEMENTPVRSQGLTEEQIAELLGLVRVWEETTRFIECESEAFMIAGIDSLGHRILVWGLWDGEQIVPQAWAVWLRGSQLQVSLGSRAANFAHHAMQELMKGGIVEALQAPLHFGWQEEALDSLQYCALNAAERHFEFPEADIEAMLKARLNRRGFGFAVRDDRLVWLVVENTPEGFRLTAFGCQQPEGGTKFNQIAQA